MRSPLTPRRTFSDAVTGSKCSGLTHTLFLHKWSITRPSGIGPTWYSYDHLCASALFPFSGPIQKRPYPELLMSAVHSMHPLGACVVFALNRSIGGLTLGAKGNLFLFPRVEVLGAYSSLAGLRVCVDGRLDCDLC